MPKRLRQTASKPDPASVSAVENLPVSLIQMAASLLLKCAGYLQDVDLAARKDNRRDTYYAIDADTIDMYIEPEENSRYLTVFGQFQNPDTSRSLSFLMGDFLMASDLPLTEGYDRHKARFLIVPPHDEELVRILAAIQRELMRTTSELDESRFSGVTKLFEKYERGGFMENWAQDRIDKGLLDGLSRLVPDLADLYNPYRGPKAALRRYADLPDNALQRLETYLEDDFTFPILDPIRNAADRPEANRLINEWKKRLEAEKGTFKKERSIETDAEVLGAVEYTNKQLWNEGKRLALITGSDYLFSACHKYVPWPDMNRRSFSDLFLRHPQAFLANSKFFSLDHSPNPTFNLIDWLNLVFPKGLRISDNPQGEVQREILDNIRRNKDHNLTKVIDMLFSSESRRLPGNDWLREWETQVTALAKARYAGGLEKAEEQGALRLAESLKILRARGSWSLEELRRMVFNESFASINKLYSKTLWVGLWSRAAREQAKGIPVIRFDEGYKVIEDYCSTVVRFQLQSVGKLITEAQLDELHQLNLQVEQADPTLYHANIIHALAFAVKGHWYAALTLCRVAMAICDNIEDSRRGLLRGREAAYLACIARRRTANTKQGLIEAQTYLSQAISRENPGFPFDIRFSCEDLAIKTRFVYFDVFCENRNLDIKFTEEIISGLFNIIEQCETEDDARVKLWIRRQACTNLLTLSIILQDSISASEFTYREKIEKLLAVFKDTLSNVRNHHHKVKDDPYANTIYKVALALWGKNEEVRKKAKAGATRALRNPQYMYTPYDAKRAELLRSVLARLPN